MLQRLRAVLLRTIGFLFIISAVLTLVFGWDHVPFVGAPSPDRYVSEAVAELERVDPQAATLLQRLRDQRSANDVAVAVRATEHGATNRISALRSLAQRGSSGRTPYEVQLAALARASVNLSDEQQTEGFFQAHATACQMLTHDESGQMVSYYLDLLDRASKDPVAWRVVRDDPVALVLWPLLKDTPKAWQYYDAEREWLASVIADLAPATEVGSGSAGGAPALSAERSYAEAVTVAMEYDPLPKRAVTELKLGAHGFALFLAFGPIIKRAVTDYGLPLDEVLDVLFINGDGFALPPDEPNRAERAEQVAAQLAQVRRSRPRVWKTARLHPLALRLNRDVPGQADQLLEKYGANDVCAFLYTNYEQQIVPAAAALTHFGDLGFYILKTYEADPRLKSQLENARVGIRVVPFLVRFGNAGFDKLDENPEWVERYFNSDGTPKKDDWEWVSSVPIVGAPAALVSNLAKGYPSEWSEWGWAALDVADGALLVASFGASVEVTAAKQVVKEGGKLAVENLTKQEAKVLARQAARQAADAVVKGGGKTVAREVDRSALARVARTGRRLVHAGGQTVVVAGRFVGRMAEPAFAGARRLREAWESLPASAQRWVFRSLLAVGMIVTIHERTIPGLTKVGEAIGEEVARVTRNAGQAVADGLIAAVRELFGARFSQQLVWNVLRIAAVLGLSLLGWRLRPWARPRLRVM